MAKAKPVTGIEAYAPTAKNAYLIAHIRLEEFNEWGRYAEEPQRISELHNLRIAAKRLRYTLELFADVLPTEANALLEEVTKVQEELGNLHDTDVMIALVHACLESSTHAGATQQKQPDASAIRPKLGTNGRGEQREQRGQREFAEVSSRLLDALISARTNVTQEERHGLERLLRTLQGRREEYYGLFRQHWHQLQEHNASALKTLEM